MIEAAPSTDDLNGLVDQLRTALANEGTAIAEVAGLHVPVEVWRKAARRAGKTLGRPTRTVVFAGTAQAYLADWPANAQEQTMHDRRLRTAMEAMVQLPEPR